MPRGLAVEDTTCPGRSSYCRRRCGDADGRTDGARPKTKRADSRHAGGWEGCANENCRDSSITSPNLPMQTHNFALGAAGVARTPLGHQSACHRWSFPRTEGFSQGFQGQGRQQGSSRSKLTRVWQSSRTLQKYLYGVEFNLQKSVVSSLMFRDPSPALLRDPGPGPETYRIRAWSDCSKLQISKQIELRQQRNR